MHRSRRIALRASQRGYCRERGNGRCQMEELTAWKFHRAPPENADTRSPRAARKTDVGLISECEPADGTSAAAKNKGTSARPCSAAPRSGYISCTTGGRGGWQYRGTMATSQNGKTLTARRTFAPFYTAKVNTVIRVKAHAFHGLMPKRSLGQFIRSPRRRARATGPAPQDQALSLS